MTDLIHLAIPAFLTLLIIEAVFDAIMRRELYDIKDTAARLSRGIGNVVVGLLGKAMAFAVYSRIYCFASHNIPRAWWAWMRLFYADDCTDSTSLIAFAMR